MKPQIAYSLLRLRKIGNCPVMVTTQKIKRPTAVSPSLNPAQNAKKCENGFFLRIMRCEIISQTSKTYKKKKRS